MLALLPNTMMEVLRVLLEHVYWLVLLARGGDKHWMCLALAILCLALAIRAQQEQRGALSLQKERDDFDRQLAECKVQLVNKTILYDCAREIIQNIEGAAAAAGCVSELAKAEFAPRAAILHRQGTAITIQHIIRGWLGRQRCRAIKTDIESTMAKAMAEAHRPERLLSAAPSVNTAAPPAPATPATGGGKQGMWPRCPTGFNIRSNNV
jgi:hypothetical protein